MTSFDPFGASMEFRRDLKTPRTSMSGYQHFFAVSQRR